MGKTRRQSHTVDIEDEDSSEPALGNQAGVYQKIVEGGSNYNH